VPARALSDLSWTDVAALDRGRVVAILPLGALEAHGPHLPLGTDVIIAEAMAHAGAEHLAARGLDPLLLPPLSYTPAPFAAEFPGTVSLDPDTLSGTIRAIASSLVRHGIRVLALANAHFDPAQVRALRDAAETSEATIVFPDLTRRVLAERLTPEFRSGACHAGRYETSIVMAARPDLVRASARSLAANPRSLTAAIGSGRTTFTAAGGPDAYFGAPADATPAEGRETIAVLGAILAEAVLEVMPR